MTRQEKAQIIKSLTDKLRESNFYLTDPSGLTASQVNKLRLMCFKEGVKYKVYKNTLIKKALENQEADYKSIYGALKGTSGIMFVDENGSIPSKIIKKYRKEDSQGRPKLKAASIDTEIFTGEDQLDTLSKLKSRQDMVAEVITLLQFPAKKVISALQSAEQKLAGIVKTLSEREN